MESTFKTISLNALKEKNDNSNKISKTGKVRVKNSKINLTKFNSLFSNIHLPIFCFNEKWLSAYEDTVLMNKKNKSYEKEYRGD